MFKKIWKNNINSRGHLLRTIKTTKQWQYKIYGISLIRDRWIVGKKKDSLQADLIIENNFK